MKYLSVAIIFTSATWSGTIPSSENWLTILVFTFGLLLCVAILGHKEKEED